MTIRSLVQGASLGGYVTLFVLDLTAFGLGVIRITPTNERTKAISFGGQTYAPHPLTADGFELTTQGSLPRPTFSVSNLDNSFTALVEQNDDLQGAAIQRIRTFDRYLDDGAEPDGSVHLPIDFFTLSQKTGHTQKQIDWTLAAAMDQEGVQLPGRQIIRDYCSHETRTWTGTTFDYTNATCPYVDDAKDENGAACAASAEVFSKRLGTCCMARFGTTAVLPTRAFPGVALLANR